MKAEIFNRNPIRDSRAIPGVLLRDSYMFKAGFLYMDAEVLTFLMSSDPQGGELELLSTSSRQTLTHNTYKSKTWQQDGMRWDEMGLDGVRDHIE